MQIKPRKALGQHFLKDTSVADRIVRFVDARAYDRIIEIGPGTGALTIPLAKKWSDIHAFEVDQRSVEFLKRNCPDVTVYPFSILDADFLKLKYGVKGDLVVVGNLPYYLTSQILFRVIDQGLFFKQAVFMIQKEVAERLTAGPRTKEYGILSVQSQVFGKTEILFTVPPDVFYPPPKVVSAVISYRPGNDSFPASVDGLPVSLDSFKSVVRTAFQQRRKKLSNSLKLLFGNHFPDGFDADRRAEELKPDEFVSLAEWYARIREQ